VELWDVGSADQVLLVHILSAFLFSIEAGRQCNLLAAAAGQLVTSE
jgi:hypothetical protein